ncbi:hypothetical protein B566_EDAN012104 [Ephemera danica]|nr:hypothetical protein B566_EDAN012104 [Ephemera danica]
MLYAKNHQVEEVKLLLELGADPEDICDDAHLDPTVTLELVKLFLPHFAHPGLTLLPFTTPEKVATLFPFLSSCGSLQNTALHTTAVFPHFKRCAELWVLVAKPLSHVLVSPEQEIIHRDGDGHPAFHVHPGMARYHPGC